MMLGIQHAEREEVFHVHCVCRGGGGDGHVTDRPTCFRPRAWMPRTQKLKLSSSAVSQSGEVCRVPSVHSVQLSSTSFTAPGALPVIRLLGTERNH